MSTTITARSVAGAGAAALAGNLATYAFGKSAGATFDVGQPYPIGPVMVAITTVVALGIGTLVYNRAIKTGSRTARWLSTGGLVFAVVSAPNGYFASHDAPTGLALGSMHLIAGAAWYFTTRSRAHS